MTKHEFVQIRRNLAKTQSELAQVLGTSLKAVQSFEQGWRNIPAYIERQMLFLHAMKHADQPGDPCWETQECDPSVRKKCPAWQLQVPNLCWFVNGTLCQGQAQGNWGRKMAVCRNCSVLQAVLPEPNE